MSIFAIAARWLLIRMVTLTTLDPYSFEKGYFWREYCKSGREPDSIDVNPDREYRYKGWIDSNDWLGTDSKSTRGRVYRSFTEARKFVRALKLKNQDAWRKYCKSGKKPIDIPANPARIYKEQYNGINDWLGTDISRYNISEFWPLERARKYVHKLGLKNIEQWREYCQSETKPSLIPSNPEKKYRKDWKDYGDWLRTGRISNVKKKFWPFVKARTYVHKLGLKSVPDWQRYCKSGQKPDYLPSTPAREYKNEGWLNWGDWLGTDTVAPQNRRYRTFLHAREYTPSLALSGQAEWYEFVRPHDLPKDIPITPHIVYKEEWIDWGDWLGTGTIATQQSGWSIERVKELIRDLIKNK